MMKVDEKYEVEYIYINEFAVAAACTLCSSDDCDLLQLSTVIRNKKKGN